jgi:hypothetical protein
MIRRVFWTEQELRKVAVRWIELCQDRGENPLAPKSLSKLARDSQMVLDPDRRRNQTAIQGVTANAKLTAMVETIVNERKKSPLVAAKVSSFNTMHSHVPAKDRPPPQLQAINTSAAPFIPSSPPSPATPQPTAATPAPTTAPTTGGETKNLEALVAEFGKSIASIIVAELTKALKTTFSEEFPKLHSRTLAVSRVLPKILVCGPLPKQQPTLEAAVSGVADLKFVSSEESAKLVTSRGQQCAAAILWTNFISHPHQSAAKALFGENNVVFANGGVETLKAVVEETALRVQIPEDA